MENNSNLFTESAVAPLLDGLFDDWQLFEIHFQRTLMASPMTLEGFLLGAIKRKDMVSGTAEEAIAMFKHKSGCLVVPNAIRVTLVQVQQNKLMLSMKKLGSAVVYTAALSYVVPLVDGHDDYASRIIGIIRKSMSKIEIPQIHVEPDAIKGKISH